MKVGVFIPYHKKLDKYLGAVVKQFSIWDKVVCRKSDFKEEKQVDVRNEALNIGCDIVFTVDADEFIKKIDQEHLVNIMIHKDPNAIMCPVFHVTKHSLDYVYEPTNHAPVVLINPKKTFFTQTRCIEGGAALRIDVPVYHFGYRFDDETIEWKKQNHWNVGNPNEIKEILRRDIYVSSLPEEIKCLVK